MDPTVSMSNLTLNDKEQQPIFGVAFYEGKRSLEIELGTAPVNISTMSYEWSVSCERKSEGDADKFVISAKLLSSYVFNDNQSLLVELEDSDGKMLQRKMFVLEKYGGKQEFELIYEKSGTVNVPFSQVQVLATLGVDPIDYQSVNWVCEYNFTSSAKTHDAVLIVGETKFYVMRSYLATWSSYFDRLFFGDSKQKNQKEFKINGVDPDVFECILQLIHPQLYGIYENEGLKKDEYKKLDLMDRLQLADENNLVHLQIACFKQIHQMDKTTRTEFFKENSRRIQKLSANSLKNLI